ncbi:MAG: Squalene synthase, partial [uncultured Gemmatimonadaceae bacterium]
VAPAYPARRRGALLPRHPARGVADVRALDPGAAGRPGAGGARGVPPLPHRRHGGGRAAARGRGEGGAARPDARRLREPGRARGVRGAGGVARGRAGPCAARRPRRPGAPPARRRPRRVARAGGALGARDGGGDAQVRAALPARHPHPDHRGVPRVLLLRGGHRRLHAHRPVARARAEHRRPHVRGAARARARVRGGAADGEHPQGRRAGRRARELDLHPRARAPRAGVEPRDDPRARAAAGQPRGDPADDRRGVDEPRTRPRLPPADPAPGARHPPLLRAPAPLRLRHAARARPLHRDAHPRRHGEDPPPRGEGAAHRRPRPRLEQPRHPVARAARDGEGLRL